MIVMIATEIVVLVLSAVCATLQLLLVFVSDGPATGIITLVAICIVFFLFYPLFSGWYRRSPEKSHKLAGYFAIGTGVTGVIYGVPMLIYLLIGLARHKTGLRTAPDWRNIGIIVNSCLSIIGMFLPQDGGAYGLVVLAGIALGIVFAIKSENARLKDPYLSAPRDLKRK